MKFAPALAPIVDRLRFWLVTAGWPGIVGLALIVVGGVGEFLVVPQQQAAAAESKQAAERSRQEYELAVSGERKGRLGTAESLARFRARLSSDADADTMFETIQHNVQKHGLAPAGTEYKWQRQRAETGLAEVRIVMPVKAGYRQLHGFVKDVLADVPGLALEQFDIRRENIGSANLDARLRFSLYLKVKA